jgi:hypothetical protein
MWLHRCFKKKRVKEKKRKKPDCWSDTTWRQACSLRVARSQGFFLKKNTYICKHMYLHTHICKTFSPSLIPGQFPPRRKKFVGLAGIVKSERWRFQSVVDVFAERRQRLSFARIRASFARISALRIHDFAPRRTSALRWMEKLSQVVWDKCNN